MFALKMRGSTTFPLAEASGRACNFSHAFGE